MKTGYMFLALVAVFATAGCQTQEQAVQGQQGMAVQTALNRARFDMNCSSATGQVLSTNVSQPAIQGTFRSAYGVQRFEYTVGVTGCGQRRTYIVVCPQGGGGGSLARCLAAWNTAVNISKSGRKIAVLSSCCLRGSRATRLPIGRIGRIR